MVSAYYITAFVISILCSAIFVFMWHKHLDVNFTMVFTLIPIACIGYIL